jgi:hypothetical protein
MASIRIRFIRTAGSLATVTAWYTGSLFSHVEFGTPTGTWIGARLIGGVQERAADYCKPVVEYTYDVPCTDEQLADHLTWMRSQIGTKYDWTDIIGLALQVRTLHRLHEYICSEFYARGMLRIFGASQFLNVQDSWAYRITPETGHLSPLLVGHRVNGNTSE